MQVYWEDGNIIHPKGKKKSILFKIPSSWFFALGRRQSSLSSRPALVFSLLLLLSTATAIYQTAVMPTVLDGICVCTDAVFETMMVLPTLGSRHGHIRDPGLCPLNTHPCCSSLGKVWVSAELGRQTTQMLLILGGDLACLWQKNSSNPVWRACWNHPLKRARFFFTKWGKSL